MGGIFGQVATAVLVALLVGGTAPWWWDALFDRTPPPPPEPRYRFEAVEKNPFTGGVERKRDFAHESRAAYEQACTSFRKVHWVKWRYFGINEPLRSKRFATRAQAQAFIDRNGPAEVAAVKGIAILSEAATLVAARVECRAIELPVAQSG